MQIHELNNKKQQVNEVDLAGPNSIFNVGKQVLKNPKAAKAFVNSSALGAAQQAAAQSSAASSANTLAKQGYTASGSATVQTTPQQQLAQVQSNPAVQRMVKNLAAQWKSQGVAAAGKIKTTKIAETVDIDPRTIKDPKEKELLNFFYKQQGLEMPQEPAAPNVMSAANQKLNAFSTEFQNWAEPKLRAIGVNLNTVMQDPWAAKTIQEILTKLSVESLSNPESPETTGLVEQFFNVVIATNQANQQGQTATSASASGTASNAAAGDEQVDDAAILKQYGLSMSTSQLDALATAMRRADQTGQGTIGNTGNVLLNALARSAGFKVAAT